MVLRVVGLCVVALSLALPARAEMFLFYLLCARCDPGNSKVGSGRIMCFDCVSMGVDANNVPTNLPTNPLVTCGSCLDRTPTTPAVCTQCTVDFGQHP